MFDSQLAPGAPSIGRLARPKLRRLALALLFSLTLLPVATAQVGTEWFVVDSSDDRVIHLADIDGDGTVGLTGHLAGFDGDFLRADLARDAFDTHAFCSLGWVM